MDAAHLTVRPPAPHADLSLVVEAPDAFVNRLLRAGLVVAVVAATVQLVVHLANGFTLELVALDANSEGNTFSWLSSVATFAVALCAFLAALARPSRRRPLFVLAACFAFFSLDDSAELHEKISARLLDAFNLSRTYDSVLWPALYLPLLALTTLLLLSLAKGQSGPIRRRFHVGLGLLVLAVVAEVVSAPWSTGANAIHLLEGGFEEGAELAGWTLLASAMAATFARTLLARAGLEVEESDVAVGRAIEPIHVLASRQSLVK